MATAEKIDPAALDAEIAEAAEAENLKALEPDEAALVNELRYVRAEKKRLAEREDTLSGAVKTLLEGYKGGTVLGKLVASLTERAGQRRCDMNELKSRFPVAYAACVKQGAPQKVLALHKP